MTFITAIRSRGYTRGFVQYLCNIHAAYGRYGKPTIFFPSSVLLAKRNIHNFFHRWCHYPHQYPQFSDKHSYFNIHKYYFYRIIYVHSWGFGSWVWHIYIHRLSVYFFVRCNIILCIYYLILCMKITVCNSCGRPMHQHQYPLGYTASITMCLYAAVFVMFDAPSSWTFIAPAS